MDGRTDRRISRRAATRNAASDVKATNNLFVVLDTQCTTPLCRYKLPHIRILSGVCFMRLTHILRGALCGIPCRDVVWFITMWLNAAT